MIGSDYEMTPQQILPERLQSEDHGKQLSTGVIIVALRSIAQPAAICDRLLSLVCYFRQDDPQTNVRRIGVEYLPIIVRR